MDDEIPPGDITVQKNSPVFTSDTAMVSIEPGRGANEDIQADSQPTAVLSDDDFGDFGAPVSTAAGVSSGTAEVVGDDDEFDDFTAAEPQPAVAPKEDIKEPITIPTDRDEEQDRRIADALTSLKVFEEADDGLKRVLERIASLYEIRHVVAPDEPISTHGLVSASNDENSNTYPHPFFLGTEWANLWLRCLHSVKDIDGIKEAFNWRHSLIRKSFLGAVHSTILGKSQDDAASDLDAAEKQKHMKSETLRAIELVDQLESHPGADSPKRVNEGSVASSAVGFSRPIPGVYDNMDSREADLLEARRLCDISQDDMRRHTVEELRDLVQVLMDYNSKMLEQSNYWLDSKEQLVMDAEMHNKMIASLVQYAQQQQVSPKGKTTEGAKKKRFGI